MSTSWIRLLHRSASVVWLTLLLGFMAVVALPHVVTHTGRTAFIIRGGSMEPTIPLGSVIAVSPVVPASLVAGDVITVRADNGVVYTHRIRAVLDDAPGRRFRLQGDANASPDGQVVPERAIVGRADAHIPLAGYALAFLAMPTGAISLVSMLGTLLLAIWLLEGLDRPRASTPRHVAPGAPRAEG